MEEKKVKIGIFGSCVSREIFNYDYDGYFDVQTYINFNSIIAQMSAPLFKKTISKEEVAHMSDWYSRVISTDINKNALETIFEKEPDYFVLDIMNERLALVRVLNENIESYLTCHNDLFKSSLFKTGGALEGYDYKDNILFFDDIDEKTIERSIRRFCMKILQYIDVSKIVYVEGFYVNYYIDKTRQDNHS